MRNCQVVLAAVMVVFGVPAALFFGQPDTASEQAAAAGRFVFTGWEGPDLPVYYQLPDCVTPDTPVVFVMHGVNRDADRYRDEWAALVRQHGFIGVVPQFSRADFPGLRGDNTGYFREEDGTARPRRLWSFAAIEPLFDDVRARFGTRAARYSIQDHSAGAQFVHRFVLFMPEARVDQAIAASAGWYTMPDLQTGFPYGLGTADTDRADPDLRKTPEADAQGQHRFARGQQFFANAKQAAERLETPLGWSIRTVPDVGHSNAKMATAAASLLAED